MAKKTKELSEDQLATLNESYPVAVDENRLTLPRLGMLSKDITEETGKGKTKKIKVIEAAGSFFTESDEGEVNEETGKKVWTKKFIEGDSIEVVIVYHRRQLRRYDQGLEKFYSTPIYDTSDQVIPLYLDGKVVKTGNQADLQAMFPAVTAKGKATSDLKEECILYAIYEGELHQVNISQSSKWEFKTYSRNLNPSALVTEIGSVEAEFGSNVFHKMTFSNVRKINAEEFELVSDGQNSVKEEAENSAQYILESGKKNEDEAEAEKDYNNIVKEKEGKEAEKKHGKF